jgi:hypothetical protein
MRTNVGTARRNHLERNQQLSWSGQQDLNLRPGVPKTPALPGCAIPRQGRGQDAPGRHPRKDATASIHASPDSGNVQ